MTDISTIPEAELYKDRHEAFTDAAVCDLALNLGITEQGGVNVEWRRDQNLKQIIVIEAELVRRGRPV